MKSKTREQIEEMYSFIGWFNDGRFMNSDYREGIMNALSFVLFSGSKLENLKSSLTTELVRKAKIIEDEEQTSGEINGD
jgi:hypothetical protein